MVHFTCQGRSYPLLRYQKRIEYDAEYRYLNESLWYCSRAQVENLQHRRHHTRLQVRCDLPHIIHLPSCTRRVVYMNNVQGARGIDARFLMEI